MVEKLTKYWSNWNVDEQIAHPYENYYLKENTSAEGNEHKYVKTSSKTVTARQKCLYKKNMLK